MVSRLHELCKLLDLLVHMQGRDYTCTHARTYTHTSPHRTLRIYTKRNAAATPHLTFYNLNFKFSDFNKELTNFLNMI